MAVLQDLVLVHIDNKPAFFARIEAITADVKPGWWQVKLLVLTIPVQVYTWILDESQIAGAPFTMGGTPVSLEAVVSPVTVEEASPPPPGGGRNEKVTQNSKVVSLLDRKKSSKKNPEGS